MKNYRQNQYIEIWEVDDILYGVYKKGVIVGLDAAKEIVELRESISNGRRMNIIGYLNNMGMIDKEAKKYFASPEACKEIKASAFIVNSVFAKLFLNGFVKVFSPPVPLRCFITEKEAVAWLKGNRNTFK